MKVYAVITGDIIGSSELIATEREKLLRHLKATFSGISKYILTDKEENFEIYRGDSFQGRIAEKEKALLVSILIRASLRRMSSNHKLDSQWDARIAVGLGEITQFGEKITESDGEAFQHSGRALDQMKKNDDRLKISCANEEWNEEWNVECILCDTIMKRWTTNQAEVIYPYLLRGLTQEKLAREIGISQPAVRKRLVTSGNVNAVQTFLRRYEMMTNRL